MHPARRVLPSPAEQAQSPSRIAAFPEHAAACGVVGHPEDSYPTGSLNTATPLSPSGSLPTTRPSVARLLSTVEAAFGAVRIERWVAR